MSEIPESMIEVEAVSNRFGAMRAGRRRPCEGAVQVTDVQVSEERDAAPARPFLTPP